MKLSRLHEDGHWVHADKQKRHSILLRPSDRDRFIRWGKRKRNKNISESTDDLRRVLEALRPEIAVAAQKVYDEWAPDEEGYDEVFGGGGICDEISKEITSVIATHIECNVYEGGHEGDDHAYLVVQTQNESYIVDIHQSVYESGGGYSWCKTPDVEIKPSDITITLNPHPIIEGYLEYNIEPFDGEFQGTFGDDELEGINTDASDGDLAAPTQRPEKEPEPEMFGEPLEIEDDDEEAIWDLKPVNPPEPPERRPSRHWLEIG